MTQYQQAKKILSILAVLGFVLGGSSLGRPGLLHAAPEAGPAPAQEAMSPVNVNTAGAEELVGIRGIGPAIAERIVQYREEFGPFQSPDDLVNVRGIGGAKLAKIKEQIIT
ncbi:MAG: ComEA family DNA-binding protein [Candidatus Omnitrophota bacterium]